MTNNERLQKIAQENGLSLFGVANTEGIKDKFHLIPKETLEGLKFGISMGYRLSDTIIDSLVDRPTKIYFHHYKQVNYLLDNIALKITSFIQESGYRGLPIPASQVIDWENLRGHLSHKMIGRYAGLGWIGRSALLINPQYGARVRYVTILTDMPLEPATPLDRDCGECRKCIIVCPAKAIGERPQDYDLMRCYEQLRLFAKGEGTRQYICGLCLKACGGKEI